jgi:hypothetical protein
MRSESGGLLAVTSLASGGGSPSTSGSLDVSGIGNETEAGKVCERRGERLV